MTLRLALLLKSMSRLATWVIPAFVLASLVAGWVRRVNVLDAFVEGARDGLATAARLMPYLVALLVAVGSFERTGGMDVAAALLGPAGRLAGLPPELVPMALLRPASGGAALAFVTETLKRHGVDSLLGRTVSTMQASCDTTLFIVTVYFGAVGVKRIRHSMLVGLLADLAGVVASAYVCRVVFGAA